MIKIDMNSKKGITLVTLAVAIIIMLIISTTLIYNISTSSKVRAINNMYQDVTIIKDKVDLYYANHHTIPVLETKYENVSHLESINPNDSDTYYVVDLEVLENLNLTYGQDYETYKQGPSNLLTDLYIINEKSHSIYYVKGISFEDKMYYTMPSENTQVTVNSVLSVELIENYENNASIKIYAVDKENGIKKITLIVNDEAVKTYEYTSGMREMKTEIVQIEMDKEENICNIQVEDEVGNIQNSESITIKQTVKYVADANGNKIPVPFGFSPITTDDQGTKETGFVIKNDNDGNEFVWVPVDNTTSYKYERVAFSKTGWEYTQTKGDYDETSKSYKITRADLAGYNFTETIPNIDENSTELESVTEYGGFYIGRYEVGVTGYNTNVSTSNSSNLTVWTGYSNGTPVVQKGYQVWNYITRDKAKEIAEGMYSELESVTSRLCSSYAWDTALKFIETQNGTYPANSTGYYAQSEPTTTGYYAINTCNIYDMGGNVWEWTTECYDHETYTCPGRGGSYNESASLCPAAIRGASRTYSAFEYNGFRTTLYL